MFKSIQFLIPFLAFLMCFCTKSIQKSTGYCEAPDPKPDLSANWAVIPDGLNACFASSFIRFLKSSIPNVGAFDSCDLTGWKGERVYSQLILWSADTIENIEFQFSDFESLSGKKMNAAIANAQFVRYVLTDEFGGGCDKRKPEDFSVSLSPDVIDSISTFSMSAKTSRPVWIKRAPNAIFDLWEIEPTAIAESIVDLNTIL